MDRELDSILYDDFNDQSSVIEFYPSFEQQIRDALKVLLGHGAEQRIKIGLAKDGSGVGGELDMIHYERILTNTSCIVCFTSHQAIKRKRKRLRRCHSIMYLA